MDEQYSKKQILKLIIVSTLLIMTPLLSTPLRTTYLYFVVNVLIIAVGADSGLLSFFLTSIENHKTQQQQHLNVNLNLVATQTSSETQVSTHHQEQGNNNNKKVKVSASAAEEAEKVSGSSLKKWVSSPSLFVVGGVDEPESEEVAFEYEEYGEEEDVEEISDQELYKKSEIFIGEFYNQLKMQRQGVMG